MAMKLCKPSFNYGASQSNLSKYEHQEHHNMSQSSHVEHGWAGAKPNHSSSYYGQGQGGQMSRAMYELDGDELSHPWADDSTNHYAQAQSVIPMPSISVQQSQRMMEKKESRVAQEWATNGAKYASPALTNHSSGAMMSKLEHGWANKPNPIQTSGYGGASMYKGQEANRYQYARTGSSSGGWANKPNGFSGPNMVDQSAQMMYGQHEQQGWANSPTLLPSSVQANHSSVAMHKEEHMMGEMDHGWAGSPIKANHSSHAMHKEEHMVGKMDHGWAASPTNANHSSFARRKDDHMVGKMDQGWAASPTRANLSSLSMRKEEHMMGKMDQGWVASPTLTKHSSHAMMHKEEHKMGQTRSLSMGSNHVNDHSDRGIHKEQDRHGWAGKHSNSFGAGQINHSAHTAYNHDECDDEGVHEIMDEILTKYPAHNVSGGPASWATKSNSSMSRSQASSYAKQQSSMASSNVSKFGMSGAMNNGGIYVDSIGVGNHGYRDCDD